MVVCPACSVAGKWKSSVQPDGGEGLAKRKGIPAAARARRHALSTVLALAAAATLCGMRGYKAISEWVDDLSPRVLQRFRVRRRDGHYRPPSLSAMRSLLIRVNPAQPEADSRLPQNDRQHRPAASARLTALSASLPSPRRWPSAHRGRAVMTG